MTRGRVRRSLRHLAGLALLAAVAAPLGACSGGSASSTGTSSAETKPARMTFEVIVLDDKPDPFATLPEGAPKGIAPFQEVVVFGPDAIETRTYVRLVVQPGETWQDAKKRAKPWFDKIALPPGDRLVFSEIVEENEVTKKREAVGARTFVATSTVVLTRDDVAEASVGAMPDPDNKPQPVAMIQLTPAAGERFRQFTKENVFVRLGVTVDGNVVMAARIQEEIQGGKISISLDPEMPYEARRAELQRIADGLKPAGAPASTGNASR
jgi:hypothetical protein